MTAEVRLRPLRPEDAAAVHAALQDWEMVRGLSAVPWPYDKADAERFLATVAGTEAHQAIGVDGSLQGIVSLREGQSLGYWIRREAWGKGYARAAARQMIEARFQRTDRPVLSGHHQNNARSRAVMLGLGFRDVETVEIKTVRGDSETLQRLQLTRPAFRFAMDPKIETARLTLRPMTVADAPAVSDLAGEEDIARMLFYVPHPFSVADAETFIGDNRWRGTPGFRWAITAKDGKVMGMVALFKEPVACAYWLGRAYWGQGFASEALTGFLRDLMPRLGLDAVGADVFEENDASHKVLKRLGFEATGRAMGTSAARVEPAPVITYRLTGLPKLRGQR